jgi:hypothetical protein
VALEHVLRDEPDTGVVHDGDRRPDLTTEVGASRHSFLRDPRAKTEPDPVEWCPPST